MRVILLVSFSLLLTACGQSGGLYLSAEQQGSMQAQVVRAEKLASQREAQQQSQSKAQIQQRGS